MNGRGWAGRAGPVLVAVVLAFAVALVLLQLAGAPPLEALRLLANGSFGSAAKISDTLAAWIPLTLAAAGLVVTFAAGLWNIGIEGQIVVGAIFGTWVAREVPGPAPLLIPLMLLAGVIGGVVWALFAGVLKTRGGVNEIFGGLGLDFVASGLAIYLIIGPWKRAGIASTSGTDLFRNEAWLPTVGAARLPAIAVFREFPLAGGLMSYGPSFADNWRRAAEYVDKIVRGAKPAELPVGQPVKFELVVNRKTEKALGLTLPPSILLRADEVLQ